MQDALQVTTHSHSDLTCQVYFFDDHTGNAAEMAEFGFNGREVRCRGVCFTSHGNSCHLQLCPR